MYKESGVKCLVGQFLVGQVSGTVLNHSYLDCVPLVRNLEFYVLLIDWSFILRCVKASNKRIFSQNIYIPKYFLRMTANIVVIGTVPSEAKRNKCFPTEKPDVAWAVEL